MKCIKCDKEHSGEFGSGKYCSRSCANSRIRTEEIKKKIGETTRKNKYWINEEWRAKIANYNKSPEKLAKVKETWKSKRDYENANIGSIKKWLKEDRGNKCEECGITEWMGKSITMEVDHIDGNVTNNSIQNLRVLCPNCHSLTPTWRGRKG